MVLDLNFFLDYLRNEPSSKTNKRSTDTRSNYYKDNHHDDKYRNVKTNNIEDSVDNIFMNKSFTDQGQVIKQQCQYSQKSDVKKKSKLDQLIDQELAELDNVFKNTKSLNLSIQNIPPKRSKKFYHHHHLEENENRFLDSCKNWYRSCWVHTTENDTNENDFNLENECPNSPRENKFKAWKKKILNFEHLKNILKKDECNIKNKLGVFPCSKKGNDIVLRMEEIKNKIGKEFGAMNVEKHRRRKTDKYNKLLHVEKILNALERDFDPEKGLLSEDEKLDESTSEEDLATQSSEENCLHSNRAQHGSGEKKTTIMCDQENNIENFKTVEKSQTDSIRSQTSTSENIYFPIEKFLENSDNDNLVLRECEFVFKSPKNNKEYLINIREQGLEPESASGDYSHCNMKKPDQHFHTTKTEKLINFISNKNRIQRPKLRHNRTTCQKMFLFQLPGCNKCQNQTIKNNKNQLCTSAPTKVKRKLVNIQRMDRPTSENEYEIDEIDFLSELCNVGNKEKLENTQSESLETKLAKKKFFDKFLQFLQNNKEELRRQYQHYRINNACGSVACASND